MFSVKRRAVFLDRDGVIVEEVDYLSRVSQLRLLRGVPASITRLRAAGFKVVVVSNQSAVARGFVTRAGLEGIHRALKGMLLKEGARLDAIYYCPHHPRAGRRTRCQCRKPKTGMLRAASRRFRLDMKESFLVGDSTTDIKTARNAGCAAILVRTGKAGKDGRYKARPDAVRAGLPEAAQWILEKSA